MRVIVQSLTVHICHVTPIELFHMYMVGASESFTQDMFHIVMHDSDISLFGGTLCPWMTASDIASSLISSRFHDIVHTQNTSLTNTVRCLLLQPLPSDDDWKAAYTTDPVTNYMISRTLKDKTPWTEPEIQRIPKSFRQHVRDNRVHFRHNLLLIFHPIGSSHRFLNLIVVPVSLRKTTFAAYHTSPTGAHMTKNKTL